MPAPADQSAFVNTGSTGNIDLGNNLPSISFNNSNPFSFEIWARPRPLPPTGSTGFILQKTGEFWISCSPGGNLMVWRAGLQNNPLSSLSPIGANQWIHIGVTFDGQTLTLYLNGIQDCFAIVQDAGIANQGYNFQLGIGSSFDIDTCRMWSIAQTEEYMYQAPWAPDPAPGTTGLVAAYDLSVTPPRDISGNNNPVTLNSPAASMLGAPGVLLYDSRYVAPAEQDLIRCGDTSYTIDAWLYLNSAVGQQAIFTTGNLNDPGGVSLWLDGGILKSQRGSTVLAATGSPVPTGAWTHVATTYDGTTLTVYVNGAAAGSVAAGAIPSLPGQSALIGAFATAAAGQTDFFQGYLQYISVWSISLTAAQVLDLMYDDPTLKPGCLANFAFSQTLPVDLNTGLPLTLLAGAVLGEQISPWTSSSAVLPEAKTSLTLPDISPQLDRNLLRKADATVRRLCDIQVQGNETPTPQAHIKLLLNELNSVFPPETEVAERIRILTAHEQRLNDLATNGPPELGSVTHAIVDGYHVLTLHGHNGQEEVFRAKVGDVDPCTVWWIKFIFTLLSGFASLLGLKVPVPARLTTFVATLIADLSFMAAVFPLFTGALTAQTVIYFLVLLYNNGYLWTFFKFCFTQLSWWSIGKLVFYVVGLFVPAPSPTKLQFFVNAAKLVYNLLQLLANKPC
jgi:hypothetical protein